MLAVLVMVSCSTKPDSPQNLIENEQETRGLVNLFGPMEKSNPNAENLARTAFDMTIVAAEEKLNLTVEYIGGDGQTEGNITNRLSNPSQYDAFAINMVKTDNSASYTALLNQ